MTTTAGVDHLKVAADTARFAPVFPCRPNKQPATTHGFKDATTDQDRIMRWWSDHPDHLVGIPTAGLLVVDLDVPDDDRPPDAAWTSWLTLAAPHGWKVTDCPIVATPSGGLHLYYTAPARTEVRNSAGKLAPLIDVRGNGGYVIAPGSGLPDRRWYEFLCPFPASVPVAPSWLVEMCTRRDEPLVPRGAVAMSHRPANTYGERALESELGRLAQAPQGERNNQLNASAHALGQLVGAGHLGPHAAHDGLLTVAMRVGLHESEAKRTIESGLRAGADSPRRPRS